jgi:hypothetical protein
MRKTFDLMPTRGVIFPFPYKLKDPEQFGLRYNTEKMPKIPY